MPDIGFERFVDLDNTEDMRRFQQIYETSFPDYTRKPMAAFHKWRDVLDIYIARADGQMVGFAVTCPLDHTPVAFMSYLAVDGSLQGQGIGGRLLDYTLSRLAEDTPAEVLIWEVEPEEPESEHPSNRRIRFYERHGARVITEIQNYLMPATIEGHPPIPMRLMWANIGGRKAMVTKRDFHQWVKAMFDTLYDDHPDLRDRTLADLRDED